MKKLSFLLILLLSLIACDDDNKNSNGMDENNQLTEAQKETIDMITGEWKGFMCSVIFKEPYIEPVNLYKDGQPVFVAHGEVDCENIGLPASYYYSVDKDGAWISLAIRGGEEDKSIVSYSFFLKKDEKILALNPPQQIMIFFTKVE